MREAFELARIGWSRHSRILWTSIAILVVGQTLFWGLWMLDSPQYLLGLVQFFTFWAGFLGIFFIADWSGPRLTKGISSWLLRQPVTTTQIVVPIVVSKTVWAAVFWIVFLIPIHYLSPSEVANEPPLLPPVFGFVGFVLLFFAVGWRPYASSLRSGVVVIGSMALFLTVLFATAYATDRGKILSSHTSLVWHLVTFALYALSVAMLFRTVAFARIETPGFGFDPNAMAEEASAPMPVWDEAEIRIRHVEPVGQFRRGLLRFESQGHFSNAKSYICFVLLPLLAAITYFGPHPATVYATVGTFACVGCVTSLVRQPNNAPNTSTLGQLVSIAPLSSATIGWTRLLASLRTYALIFSLAVIPFAIWWVVPHHKHELANLATQAGGRKIFFAWIGISSYLAFTRIFAAEFCDRFGKAIIAISMIAAGSVFYIAVLGICLNWFFKQSDFDTMWACLESYSKWTTPVLASLCGVKAVATMIAVVFSVSRHLYNLPAAIGVFAVWLAIVSMGVALGWPLRHPIWMDGTTLVLAIVVATPLARPLLIPWATSINRHR
jgi:hypothetical protein